MLTCKIVNIDDVLLILTMVNMIVLVEASSNCKRQTHLLIKRTCITWTNLQQSDSNKNLVLGPRCCLTPRETGWLNAGHNFDFDLNELVVGQLPAGKNMSTEAEDIVGIHHQAVTGVNTAEWEVLVRAVVNCRVCELAITLQLCVVMICMCSINPITNPNPVCSHSYRWQYFHLTKIIVLCCKKSYITNKNLKLKISLLHLLPFHCVIWNTSGGIFNREQKSALYPKESHWNNGRH
jgi:hypothetical protein